MPLTLCDAPFPVRVSSSLSILSHARLVKTSGLIEAGSTSLWLEAVASFWGHRAVMFSGGKTPHAPACSVFGCARYYIQCFYSIRG